MTLEIAYGPGTMLGLYFIGYATCPQLYGSFAPCSQVDESISEHFSGSGAGLGLVQLCLPGPESPMRLN